MDRNKLMQLQQGPEAKPRNYLADMAREYGLYGISDRLNSPTSGVGMVVDAVGGLGNALVVQPAQSFNRLLSQGYTSGDPQGAEDAFNVAGAAMLGGIAAPRPRGSIGMSGRPEGAAAMNRPSTVRAYRGSNNEFDIAQFDPAASNPAWRTNEGALFFGSQDVANFYGAPQTAFDQQLYRSIVQKHTKPDGRINPQAIAKEYDEVAPQQGAASVMPADINTSNFGQANLTGYRWDADEGARLKAKIDAAKAQGKDGLIINGMMDASGYPDTQYAVWGRGNVTSPLTGELLYAGGGRPGAAVGAATSAPQDNRELKSILDKYGLGNLLPQSDWASRMQPGDA